ncbi:MAG: ribosome recycling factor [Candidatus Roizmanbacteria bacterium GW2011_GWA2_36_23]|uniref:Ribosome recycling factor n=1 Tax=Candidatus Roizmanbacteria bacterium GW2011_GWA2_36_23 TaxID=1618480 RepID=A0A0G0E8D7_9BACT|nr:MAG: ribosome recycling factor [Candidatus Roizmanbacteria bacterium GW2011_GWA2_36_23]
MDFVNQFKQQSLQSINVLKDDLKSIRTGRATPSLVENIVVEVYGGQTKLKLVELSNIASDGPSSLSLTPYDVSTISDIEKAILKSPLGISPVVQGNRIIVRIPPLSQEQREKMLKLVGQKIEEKRVVVRNQRDSIRKSIKSSFESKELTEDQKYRLEKDIDDSSQKIMQEIDVIKTSKEKEVMEI